MMDLTATITAKSDQLNADDLLGGPMTITVEGISANPGDDQQPISITYGDPNKVYKPCKSMRKMMIAAWGKDGNAFVGRRMTLFRDPTVSWGGVEVGGLRISHMSHIDAAVTQVIAASKQKKKAVTVLPLVEAAPVVFTIEQIIEHIGADAVNAYLIQTTWLSEGQTAADLNEQQQSAITANPDGFASAVNATKEAK